MNLYYVVIVMLIFSFIKDKKKTKQALKKSYKVFLNLLPQLLSLFIIIGLILTFITPEAISKLIGESSGVIGSLIAAIIGSITLLPGFVAFPLAKNLLENGAGYSQIAVFISTLMMVGLATLPMEIKHFGVKVSVLRNLLALGFSFIVGAVIGGLI